MAQRPRSSESGQGPLDPAALQRVLAVAIDQAAEAVMVTTPDGTIVYVNDAFERLTGYTSDEAIGKTPRILKSGKQDETFYHRYWETVLTGKVWHGEIVNRRKDGTLYVEEHSATPVFDDRGQIAYFLSIGHDATGRRRLQSEIQLLETVAVSISAAADFSSALAAVLRAVCEVTGWSYGEAWTPSLTGDVLECSPVWYASEPGLDEFHTVSETFSFRRDEGLPGRIWASRQPEWHSDVSVLPGSRFPRAAASTRVGLQAGFGVPIIAGEDVLAILAFFVRETRKEDSQFVEVVSAVAVQLGDLMRRKRAEQEAARLAAIVESSVDAIIGLDITRNIASWNAGAGRLFGYPDSEALGQPVSLLAPPDRKAECTALLDDVLAGARVSGFEIVCLARDGRRLDVALSIFPVTDLEGNIVGAAAIARDVSERRKAEEALLQAQKLESLGVLAGGIAHDFNNLLVGILGGAGLALAELSPESPARATIKDIETTAQRAAELIRQMLAYSGQGRFIVQRLNLNSLIEEMTHLFRMSISKNAVLRYNFAPSLPVIEADATQMRQVLMNLVINASDAIGDRSGVITVNTGVMRADRAYLTETYLAPDLPEGDYVYIEVVDTGAGMDAETKARIFDPFFTTKFTGRGLGLAAVLGIVRGHRGAIKVYTEPGRGSTFKVLLPCVAAPADFEQPPAESPDDWRGHGTVLVVDDEETVRVITARTLAYLGFTVLLAADGLEGVETFRAHAGDIACVLLDMTMPRLNGEAAFREIHRIRPDARVILMSGYNEQEATDRFAGKGLAGFLQKPYQLNALRDALRTAIEGPQRAGSGA